MDISFEALRICITIIVCGINVIISWEIVKWLRKKRILNY